MIDLIVERPELRSTLVRLLDHYHRARTAHAPGAALARAAERGDAAPLAVDALTADRMVTTAVEGADD
jgi:hypothetical protein